MLPPRVFVQLLQVDCISAPAVVHSSCSFMAGEWGGGGDSLKNANFSMLLISEVEWGKSLILG